VGISALLLIATIFLIWRERKRRLAAEQKYRAVVSADNAPQIYQRQEMEQPEGSKMAAMRVGIHEAPSRTMYEVQG
jgi:hypothetical protein